MGSHRADPGVTMDPVLNEEAAGFLSEAPVAHLGLVSEGKPYVTPMAFVVDDGRDPVSQPGPGASSRP